MKIYKIEQTKIINMDAVLGAVYSSYKNPQEKTETFYLNRKTAEEKLFKLEAARHELNDLSYRFEIIEVEVNDR